jgi:hypothetical protein
MKHGCFIAVAVLALFAPGCRNARDHKMLFREMRLLEDQIYALEDEKAHLEAQLTSVRRENESLRAELGDEPSDTAPRRARSRSNGDLRAPAVEMPDLPSRSRGEGDAPTFDPAEEAPKFEPGAEFIPAPSFDDAPSDPNVNEITFHRLLTGGYDADGIPGDEGVSVVILPKNPQGQLVRTPGDVEVAVIDPDRGGARVAQWRFTTAELSETWARRAVGEGFFLELPWPNQPPDNRQLELIVTYRTPRGKRLIAQKSIAVDPAGGRFAEWTSAETASSPAPKPRQVQRAGWSPYR